ncbi:hypothetical protein TraAM80_01359 [Trypanosoma rangeli]|uniref:Uncharacterized protein n=1 Tax=Trypanosoma rangeli TaxID=5698 RepID=A0A3S5ISE5_TRYRA|nr:uncharacterized protein TraAM80_01359 [Trypanosoma rangeli]RNF10815.1 hypothetical protein TraAM80_01359 [Trypanosoma rangeli]|eukprot:RNF10815.1 hypothetical protein TraAM80_01359 [Trypanosoma rangeli]
MQSESPFSVPPPQDTDTESTTSSESVRGKSSSRSLSASSSGRRSGSRRSRRGMSSERESKRRPATRKNYADHVPMFPNLRRPTTILLDPFPNRRVRSVCIAGGMLVTAHRNGIRIYRQRYLTALDVADSRRGDGGRLDGDKNTGSRNTNSGDNCATDVRTGIWDVVESRDSFQLRDAYLCVGAESAFSRERVLPLRWNRYLAVASGSDRTRFSVCVLSTAAHFLLHHELHAKNRVVALHFALVAVGPNSGSRRYQPLVVSVDEVGEVVIFDIEKDRAVKLTVPTTTPTVGATPASEALTANMPEDNESPEAIPCKENANNNNNISSSDNKGNDNSINGTDGGDTCSGAGHHDVPLPCPNKCNTALTLQTSRSTYSGGAGGETFSAFSLRAYRLDAGLATNIALLGPCQVYCKHCCNVSAVPGTFVMSLYISSHAHGVEGQAEMHVSHLRFRWWLYSPRAVVLSETPILREGAPEDVCDIGVAMLRIPFCEELPPSFTIGRPRLRFWSLSGCTGSLLHLHRVYHDKGGSGKGARTVNEHFLRVVPLGRQILVQDVNTSWFCIAALTDDDVILLLGKEPRPVGRSAPLHQHDPSASVPVVDGRDSLETWLSDVEEAKEVAPSQTKPQPKLLGSTIADTVPLPRTSFSQMFMDPNHDYTVLMMLTAPGTLGVKTNSNQDTVIPPTRILLFVPHSNELLFFMGGCDDIHSIYLPFVRTVAPGDATAKSTEMATIQKLQKTSPVASSGWMEAALSASQLLDLKIARPLMSAMWVLAGEVGADEESLPPLSPTPLPPSPQAVTSQPQPQQQQQLETPASTGGEEEGGRMLSNSRNVMNVHIGGDGSPTSWKKKRRNDARSMVQENDQTSGNEDDMRRAYIEEEWRKLLNTQHWSGMKTYWQRGGVCAEYAGMLKRLTTMEEPLERNTIVYEWSDAHDDLYLQFIHEGLEIVEAEKTRDTTLGVSTSQHTRYGSLRDCVTLSEFTRGDHSAGFMRAFRDAQWRRQQLHDNGGIFNFAEYFSSLAVPQRLLDMQEDDRCRFELADLKASFEDDIKKFNEVETVLVYENQERVVSKNGLRRWAPHPTFPFDDENGDVIDIVSLNSTATIRTPLTLVSPTVVDAARRFSVGWRWASEMTDDHSSRVGGSKLVRKELQSWHVGEWMYATRWPKREEEARGTFQWSASDNAGLAKVRRRHLTRSRINVAIEAAKEAREQEYMKKLEELRRELDL